METTEGFVTAGDGVRLFYQTIGTGASVVVVPNGIYLAEDLAAPGRDRLVVFFDPRNRGRSDTSERAGILQDVEDTRTIARHFTDEPVSLIGHSFAGLLVALVARMHPAAVRRVVQIGPLSFNPDRQFPASLMNRDDTFARVMAGLGALLPQRPDFDPETFCEKVWSILRPLYVTREEDAPRIQWGRCSLTNERNGMSYFNSVTLPSIRALTLDSEAFGAVHAPVLVVHGTKDRSAPYGGGREWAMTLPDARLVSVADGGHAPWIERPDVVVPAIETFLAGDWPGQSERVVSLLANGQ